MTSLYPIRQRINPAKPKPRRPRRYGRKGSRRKNSEATPPPPLEPPRTPLSALGDSFMERFQCLSTVDDDEIEVHFFDGFLDGDQPFMPSFCSSVNKPSRNNRGLDTSGFTDDTTTANTSADDSMISYPENHGGFGVCLNGEFPVISLGMGSPNDNEILEDDQEDETGGGHDVVSAVTEDVKENKNGGWMPSISNMWGNVVSSNLQCWQGPADLSPEPTFKRAASIGTVKDRKSISSKSTKKKDEKLPKESSFSKDSLEIKPSFVDEKDTDSLFAMGPLEGSRNSSSDEEPLVGRQLFAMGDRNENDSSKDDSQSTAMTNNYSASQYVSGIPMSMKDEHFLFLSDDEDDTKRY